MRRIDRPFHANGWGRKIQWIARRLCNFFSCRKRQVRIPRCISQCGLPIVRSTTGNNRLIGCLR